MYVQDRPHFGQAIPYMGAAATAVRLPLQAPRDSLTAAAPFSAIWCGRDRIYPSETGLSMIMQSEITGGETLARTLERRRSAALAASYRSGMAALAKSNVATCKLSIESGSLVLHAPVETSPPLDRQDFMLIGGVLANAVLTAECEGVDCELSLLPSGDASGVLARLTPTVLAPLSDIESDMSGALAKAGDRVAQAAAWHADSWPSWHLFGTLRRAARESGAWLDVVIDDARRTLIADVVAAAAHASDEERTAHDLALRYGPEFPNHVARREPLRAELAALGDAVESGCIRNEARARAAIMNSPLLLVLGTERDSPADWMRAGIALQRLLLLTNGAGLCATVHPEIAEQPEWRDAVGALVFARGKPQLVLHFCPIMARAA